MKSLFARCASAFVVAAAIVAVARGATPFAHAWWLVAYLALVGGVSQALLGPGLSAIAARAGARGASHTTTAAQLVLWNVGTVAVAVAVVLDAPPGVLAGSVLLLVALGSFARSLRRTGAVALRRTRPWAVGYAALVVFLVSSVFVGAALAGALPGQ